MQISRFHHDNLLSNLRSDVGKQIACLNPQIKNDRAKEIGRQVLKIEIDLEEETQNERTRERQRQYRCQIWN